MADVKFSLPNWFEKINDAQLDSLVDDGFIMLDDCFAVKF